MGNVVFRHTGQVSLIADGGDIHGDGSLDLAGDLAAGGQADEAFRYVLLSAPHGGSDRRPDLSVPLPRMSPPSAVS